MKLFFILSMLMMSLFAVADDDYNCYLTGSAKTHLEKIKIIHGEVNTPSGYSVVEIDDDFKWVHLNSKIDGEQLYDCESARTNERVDHSQATGKTYATKTAKTRAQYNAEVEAEAKAAEE